jgi:hypothetical protein
VPVGQTSYLLRLSITARAGLSTCRRNPRFLRHAPGHLPVMGGRCCVHRTPVRISGRCGVGPRCSFCGTFTGPFSEVEGLFTVLICIPCLEVRLAQPDIPARPTRPGQPWHKWGCPVHGCGKWFPVLALEWHTAAEPPDGQRHPSARGSVRGHRAWPGRAAGCWPLRAGRVPPDAAGDLGAALRPRVGVLSGLRVVYARIDAERMFTFHMAEGS